MGKAPLVFFREHAPPRPPPRVGLVRELDVAFQPEPVEVVRFHEPASAKIGVRQDERADVRPPNGHDARPPALLERRLAEAGVPLERRPLEIDPPAERRPGEVGVRRLPEGRLVESCVRLEGRLAELGARLEGRPAERGVAAERDLGKLAVPVEGRPREPGVILEGRLLEPGGTFESHLLEPGGALEARPAKSGAP
jgi:hypothetical protein